MDSRYSIALRGIRSEGRMGDFLKEAVAVLSEDELRAIVNAAEYELDRYKKFKTRYTTYSGSALFSLVGKRIVDMSNEELCGAIKARSLISKTMTKAIKKEIKRRKSQ